MYPLYKAQRPPPPDDLIPQFPLIRDAVRAFGVPCIEQDGVEADDIIASYALAALREGFDVSIVSSDKDLMQLIQPGLDLYDTMKNCRINRAEVIEKFGRASRAGRRGARADGRQRRQYPRRARRRAEGRGGTYPDFRHRRRAAQSASTRSSAPSCAKC